MSNVNVTYEFSSKEMAFRNCNMPLYTNQIQLVDEFDIHTEHLE